MNKILLMITVIFVSITSIQAKDEAYTHSILHNKTIYVCIPTKRFLLDGSKKKVSLSQKEAERMSFFFKYEGDTLNLGTNEKKDFKAKYSDSVVDSKALISGDMYVSYDLNGFLVTYTIYIGSEKDNGKYIIPLVRTILNDDGTRYEDKNAMLFFHCSNTID